VTVNAAGEGRAGDALSFPLDELPEDFNSECPPAVKIEEDFDSEKGKKNKKKFKKMTIFYILDSFPKWAIITLIVAGSVVIIIGIVIAWRYCGGRYHTRHRV